MPLHGGKLFDSESGARLKMATNSISEWLEAFQICHFMRFCLTPRYSASMLEEYSIRTIFKGVQWRYKRQA